MTTAEDPQLTDMPPQTAAGKVLWHFTMSLDGFVAGPDHAMDWMAGTSNRPGLVAEYAATTGAVLGGRDGHDAYPDVGSAYGGAWQGPGLVLTHHADDTAPSAGITFLSCDVADPVRLELLNSTDPALAENVRHRPLASGAGDLSCSSRP